MNDIWDACFQMFGLNNSKSTPITHACRWLVPSFMTNVALSRLVHTISKESLTLTVVGTVWDYTGIIVFFHQGKGLEKVDNKWNLNIRVSSVSILCHQQG